MSALEDRMKDQYENRTRYYLPRRTYTIIRLDGKTFHTYTQHAFRPFDARLSRCFMMAAIALCEEAQGAKFAYTQSDEISILLTDFEKPTTAAWFDGNIQKIGSVSASIVTEAFNREAKTSFSSKAAHFDARVFTIPDYVEVENYFISRQKDCTRNSISMLAQSLYSAKQLHGKSCGDMQEMCFVAGSNWNDQPKEFKRGRMIVYENGFWTTDLKMPVFTQDKTYLTKLVPRHWAEDTSAPFPATV